MPNHRRYFPIEMHKWMVKSEIWNGSHVLQEKAPIINATVLVEQIIIIYQDGKKYRPQNCILRYTLLISFSYIAVY